MCAVYTHIYMCTLSRNAAEIVIGYRSAEISGMPVLLLVGQRTFRRPFFPHLSLSPCIYTHRHTHVQVGEKEVWFPFKVYDGARRRWSILSRCETDSLRRRTFSRVGIYICIRVRGGVPSALFRKLSIKSALIVKYSPTFFHLELLNKPVYMKSYIARIARERRANFRSWLALKKSFGYTHAGDEFVALNCATALTLKQLIRNCTKGTESALFAPRTINFER